MFTDMVGFSALMQRNEGLALQLLERHNAIVRGILPLYSGREIKTLGDAFLVEFTSAVAGAECALAIQRAIGEWNAEAGLDLRFAIRIGLHVGDVVIQGDDVLGDGVNVASRIQSVAEPGKVYASADFARQVRNKAELELFFVGLRELKNLDHAVEVWEIRAPGTAADPMARDPQQHDPGAPRHISSMPRYAVGASILSLLFLLAAIGLVIRQVRWGHSSDSVLTEESTIVQLTNRQDVESAAIAPDGRFFAYITSSPSDIWLRQIAGGEPVQITDDGKPKGELAYSADGMYLYYTTLQLPRPILWRVNALGGTPQKVLEGARFAAPSVDGKTLLFVRTDDLGTWPSLGSIGAATLEGTDPRILAPDRRQLTRPTLSPDGRWVAFSEGALFQPRKIRLLDLANGDIADFSPAYKGSALDVIWHRDGKRLYVVRGPDAFPLARTSDVDLVERDGSVERLTLNVRQRFGEPTISADGKRLLFVSSSASTEIWKAPLAGNPVANGRAAVRLLDQSWRPFWIHLPSDGQTVLFNGEATGSQNLWTMRLNSPSSPRQVTFFVNESITHSALSPDGTTVAFSRVQQEQTQIWTSKVDGSELRQITNDPGHHYWPFWSPDGQWIGFGTSHSSGLWKVSSNGGQEMQISAAATGIVRGDWSPKGDRIVFWAKDSSRVVDAASGKVVFESSALQNTWSVPAWNPAGTHFAAIHRAENESSIWLYGEDIPQGKEIVRLPPNFHLYFRLGWTDGGRAIVFNRREQISDVVLLDKLR